VSSTPGTKDRSRYSALAAQGVLEKATDSAGKPLRGRFNLLESVNAYIRYLRSQLAGGLSGADEYTIARARRMSALADIEQLRLKRIHGELHHREDVNFCLTQMITAAKQRLLAIPSRCARPLVGKTDISEVAELIRVEMLSPKHPTLRNGLADR
jgi:phage terminase Nu1 subunit (DNA packaging protein)